MGEETRHLTRYNTRTSTIHTSFVLRGALLTLFLVAACAHAPQRTVLQQRDIPQATDWQATGWKVIFQGIELVDIKTYHPPKRILALRVDLTDPGIRFFSTPRDRRANKETLAQTASQFLRQHRAQVAINANFFAPCCEKGAEPKDLLGLAISDGQIVSPSDGQVSENIGEVPASLLLTKRNRAVIRSTKPGEDLSRISTAVSAGPRLLRDGKVVVAESPPDTFADLNPRTAVGVTQDGTRLIFAIIDGRQPGYSVGATLFQTAKWLQKLGAYQGLNLDGGGSTTLVVEDASTSAKVVNSPSGKEERYNGNHLGIYASALIQKF